MKNIVEEKIDKTVSDVPSFDETWNKVDVTRLNKKESKKPWIIALCSGAGAVALTAAIVIPLAMLNRTPESYSGVVLLKQPAKAEYNYKTSVISDDFKEKLSNFSAKFTDLAFDFLDNKNANQCVSPLSLYMALSLVEECSSGTARQEILSALGMTHDDVSTMTKPLFEASTREFYSSNGANKLLGREMLSNSIWMSPEFEKKDACLTDLANRFYCYPYEADWLNDNENANKALRKFISNETNGLIDHDWNFDISTLFLLMNTLYWKDSWLDTGEAVEKWGGDYSFTDYQGNKKGMTAYETDYSLGKEYETDSFRSFVARTCHGYKLYFVIPKDDYSLKDIWNENTVKEASSFYYSGNYKDDEKRLEYHTRCVFPEFSVNTTTDLSPIFMDGLGIKEIFTNEHSMGTLTDGNCVCTGALQETRLDINKKGGEGAAVTIIYGAESAAPDEYESVYQDFVVDRTFGYILSDLNNIPIFSGVINQIQ